MEQLLTSAAIKFAEGLGRCFYLVSPSRNTFTLLDQVPDYFEQVGPYIAGMFIIETAITALKSRHDRKTRPVRLNDTLSSLSAGLCQQLSELVAKNIEIASYVFIHNHYCLLPNLDITQLWVWIVAFLGVDFGYYWFHRMAHEINIIWAGHSVHHSSEEYNLSTALRHSVLQDYFSWIFYLPLALVIPPPMYVTHLSLNLIYQFWIHTSLVPNLGWVEYILNTPTAHKIHHARNREYIDKNYGGVLIIWDRLFGTYQGETVPALYGLTHSINTFDVFWVQFGHLVHIGKTVHATPKIWHKLAVLFAGPGWTPQKPSLRLGDINDIPDVPNLLENPNAEIKVYNPPLLFVRSSTDHLINILMTIYTLIQFLFTLFVELIIIKFTSNLPFSLLIPLTLWVVLSLWNLSCILDAKKRAHIIEGLRLVILTPWVARYVVHKLPADPLLMVLNEVGVKMGGVSTLRVVDLVVACSAGLFLVCMILSQRQVEAKTGKGVEEKKYE
ncbi:hypothetical protein HDV05_005241 [Chytridiales sp. JEL 0842]|nr:hypothetical protein HDV05_005241 [Chytridiales sp. JEL 0842]